MHVHTQAQVQEYWHRTYLTRLEIATHDHESQQHNQRPCGPSADVRQSENDGSQQNCTMTSLQANSFPTCLLPQAKQLRLGLPNTLLVQAIQLYQSTSKGTAQHSAKQS